MCSIWTCGSRNSVSFTAQPPPSTARDYHHQLLLLSLNPCGIAIATPLALIHISSSTAFICQICYRIVSNSNWWWLDVPSLYIHMYTIQPLSMYTVCVGGWMWSGCLSIQKIYKIIIVLSSHIYNWTDLMVHAEVGVVVYGFHFHYSISTSS